MSPWQSGRSFPRFLNFFMTPPKPQLETRLTLLEALRRLLWTMFTATMETLTRGRRSQVSGNLECHQLYPKCSFPVSRGRYSTCVVSVVDTLYVLGNNNTCCHFCINESSLFAGGQINPNGSESINLQIVEKLTVGQDKAWVRLPDLQKRRQV